MSAPASTTIASDDTRGPRRAVVWGLVLGVAALFLVTSAVRAPVPAVNEPHYLVKAKHYWDRSWCAGDFFLASANAHVVFYAAIGWLTRWLTLAQTAWVGRVLALLLLAWGWQRLCGRLFVSPTSSLVAAAIWVLLMAVGSFSGEWVIGGVEAKVFAYAFALWGAACALDRRWIPAGALVGAAVSFHPVVGVWFLAAAGCAGALSLLRVGRASKPSLVRGATKTHADDPSQKTDGLTTRPTQRTSRLQSGLALAAFVLCSLPGLVPAAQLVIGVEPALAREADRIQVSQRIGHHIDPMLFPAKAYWLYALLLAAWLVLSRWTPPTSSWKAVNRFGLGAFAIALVGLLAGWLPALLSNDPATHGSWWKDLRDQVLKFYPFRLADVAIPAIVALLATHVIEAALSVRTFGRRLVPGVTSTALLVAALLLPAPDANPSGMTPAHRRDWIELCDWFKSHTPRDSLLGTANEDWAVKWHAERPEYVNFKDCPQDPAGIVEWWRRRQFLIRWSRDAKQDGLVSAAELHALHDETGIDYLIASRYSGIEIEPIHRQGPFKVYQLPTK
jgi:hypothetical protein